ncbi:YdcF family protein [uncultured Litoreibacter sp.]|uniref:YdcF family protein n=1 Tax=uncultured Litoreibacter sp. TaxID=1392394 RepID=UPI00262ADB98|nr:YdcF family protein [uncultured Litoreibacter sp.]
MAVAVSALGIIGVALFNPAFDAENAPPTEMIVVLGAGMDPDGTLHRSSRLRVETGVKLWHAKAATRIHFAGGRAIENGPSAGEQMAALARSMGVPADAISHEDRSLSTLQNAYFSHPFVAEARSIRLVSEGFHLLRGSFSFRWSAWHHGTAQPKIRLSHSERFRATSPGSRFPAITMVLREVAAFWFNGMRVIGFELGGVAGITLETREPWLD